MAGHNKWSSIKHKKAKTDAQRGKIFSKISRELMMAAKLGGADTEMNARLRLALQKAKEANMPNDNINRAIQKGAGGGADTELEELQFEAYASDGIALLIDVLTDNRNRSVANVKFILSKGGASFANQGAVSYLFETKGLLLFEKSENEEEIMDLAIDSGAEDVESKEDGSIEVVTTKEDFEAIKAAFDEREIAYDVATITKVPSTVVEVSEEKAEAIQSLIEKIEDDDDVQDVYSNMHCS